MGTEKLQPTTAEWQTAVVGGLGYLGSAEKAMQKSYSCTVMTVLSLCIWVGVMKDKQSNLFAHLFVFGMMQFTLITRWYLPPATFHACKNHKTDGDTTKAGPHQKKKKPTDLILQMLISTNLKLQWPKQTIGSFMTDSSRWLVCKTASKK